MARPVIALLTDFGLHDHYVGVMKAVILGIAREASFIDITHDIAPQDIVAGALELEAVVSYLPAGTVLVGVVDPGVGSERRGVAVEAGGLTLVGPDNGLFTLALNRLGQGRAVELREPRFALPAASLTFEGRDRFAPAAAYLASGIDLAALGPSADSAKPNNSAKNSTCSTSPRANASIGVVGMMLSTKSVMDWSSARLE